MQTGGRGTRVVHIRFLKEYKEPQVKAVTTVIECKGDGETLENEDCGVTVEGIKEEEGRKKRCWKVGERIRRRTDRGSWSDRPNDIHN